MFVLSNSKNFNHSPLVIAKATLLTEDIDRESLLEIMLYLTAQSPIIRYGETFGYKKFINRNLYLGCRFISNNRDENQRTLPMFFCLKGSEHIDMLDQDIRVLQNEGYNLSDREISEIKDCLVATRKKYTFSFVISLIIQKIISFFRGE